MSVVVLDTHPWLLWLHDPNQLPQGARRLLRSASEDNKLLVSAISMWEVALKVRSGKLSLRMELDTWFSHARSYPGVQVISITPDDAIESTRLPGDFGGDPVDRLIVAVARRHGAHLISKDQRILDYAHVQSAW